MDDANYGDGVVEEGYGGAEHGYMGIRVSIRILEGGSRGTYGTDVYSLRFRRGGRHTMLARR